MQGISFSFLLSELLFQRTFGTSSNKWEELHTLKLLLKLVIDKNG